MKKTCLLLLLLVGIIYINEGYKIISEDMPVKSTTKGSLSDIAEEVIAIPLETTSDCRLKHATQIKRDRNELFLVSNGQLFHFDCYQQSAFPGCRLCDRSGRKTIDHYGRQGKCLLL